MSVSPFLSFTTFHWNVPLDLPQFMLHEPLHYCEVQMSPSQYFVCKHLVCNSGITHAWAFNTKTIPAHSPLGVRIQVHQNPMWQSNLCNVTAAPFQTHVPQVCRSFRAPTKIANTRLYAAHPAANQSLKCRTEADQLMHTTSYLLTSSYSPLSILLNNSE